ncbi:uncharacterized protein LOC135339165 isoform X2 [Halichondria panicea]|uniref:uncharacterized protein LOC135339165 isoform X2 n=1 Tax=Halichondria panicea TaxID=6063 RepID=UPI00312B7025
MNMANIPSTSKVFAAPFKTSDLPTVKTKERKKTLVLIYFGGSEPVEIEATTVERALCELSTSMSFDIASKVIQDRKKRVLAPTTKLVNGGVYHLGNAPSTNHPSKHSHNPILTEVLKELKEIKAKLRQVQEEQQHSRKAIDTLKTMIEKNSHVFTVESTSWGVSLSSNLAKLFLMSESREIGDEAIKAQMRACMDMDDRADTEVLSLTLKWCKKRLSDMRIDERRKVLGRQPYKGFPLKKCSDLAKETVRTLKAPMDREIETAYTHNLALLRKYARENPIEAQQPGKLYKLFNKWVQHVYGTFSAISTDKWAQILLKENALVLTGMITYMYVYSSNMCISLQCQIAGIPKAENTQLQNIHFITCSNEMDCIDLAEGFIEDLVKLETEGIVVYDAHLQCEVLLIATVIALICDNPRASELTSHLGSAAKHYCRICMSNRDTTAHMISRRRSKEASLNQMGIINRAQTKSLAKQLQTKYGLYGQTNALFQLSVDLYKSTPIECLHTILLGAYKYLFKDLMQKATVFLKKSIAAKITAFPASGRTSSLSGGITRYYQSCVGRDFKALAEMAPFVLWEHLTCTERKIWLLLSEVFRAAYCEQVSAQTVENVKEVTKELVETVRHAKPELLLKPKFHLFLHLHESMQSFGPTMAYNTERCESFNGLMREHNLHTNRQSSSRDIAKRFAVMEQLYFLLNKGV